ncbi:hypothetical protein GTY77_18805, partial [Streptomyces sp. SID8380]|nr:hypothetical protein [Streptomyces sp. SID8380]
MAEQGGGDRDREQQVEAVRDRLHELRERRGQARRRHGEAEGQRERERREGTGKERSAG